ncbi:isoaspartyl peptidase/L-asparaginase family protein [Fodinibius halophilus]|uniref:Isoaspartyl peptidase n=1 Tax=Fodinibius halophilus TaxID=1736908 RepID=A0A6M1TFB5_9BACT|nr:isoaspartyl peptidase/L-asparaginase [Fodinibius halophilus]NGP87310.1 isoaspartyl peptidase/L-asparaginase [Fodinibius halophilus]
MKFGKALITVLVLGVITGAVYISNQQEKTTDTKKKDWALVIHGGAGTISKDKPDSVVKAYKNDLSEALAIGEDILKSGGSALDAVENVINYLENNPKFNAGKGAVFTHDGGHELDAAIMLGNTREAGTITGVKTVKNPISLARLVMENSKHVMFAGDGAEKYADKFELERVNQEYFYTEHRHKAWKRALKREKQKDAQSGLMELTPKELKEKYGTVGAVAVDKEGQIVAGTSTGGMTNKKFGRVGDVPIIGSGTYASDVVAVSMTGWGEKIMRAVSGHTVSAYMKHKPASLEEAGSYLLEDLLNKGEAGMIAVDKDGNTYMGMNTLGMFRGAADSEGNREVAIWE